METVTSFISNAWVSVKSYAPELVWSLITLYLAAKIAKVVSGFIQKRTKKIVKSQTLASLFATITRVVLVAIGAIVALRILNLDGAITSLIAGAGIVGLALGFAFQDIASNFIAGVVLSAQNKLEVGDLVEVNDVFGTVKSIDLRITEIQTLTGQMVYVPNKEIFLNTVTDYSRLGRRRVDITVGVAYNSDLSLVKKTTLKAIELLPTVDKNQSIDLYFQEFDESSINFTVRFWTKFNKQTDWLEAQSQAIMAIKSAYEKVGITIPFPIRTIQNQQTNKVAKL